MVQFELGKKHGRGKLTYASDAAVDFGEEGAPSPPGDSARPGTTLRGFGRLRRLPTVSARPSSYAGLLTPVIHSASQRAQALLRDVAHLIRMAGRRGPRRLATFEERSRRGWLDSLDRDLFHDDEV